MFCSFWLMRFSLSFCCFQNKYWTTCTHVQQAKARARAPRTPASTAAITARSVHASNYASFLCSHRLFEHRCVSSQICLQSSKRIKPISSFTLNPCFSHNAGLSWQSSIFSQSYAKMARNDTKMPPRMAQDGPTMAH